MEIGLLIAETAKKYIGKTEKPNNSGFTDAAFETKMREVGWETSLAWCSFFSELVWTEAMPKKYRAELGKLFSGSATTTFKNFDLSPDWETGKTPKVGAVAIWRHGNGWQGHAGIVVGITDKVSFKTAEGNTNDIGGREGYIVALKNRVTNGKYQAKGLNLVGFIYPKE